MRAHRSTILTAAMSLAIAGCGGGDGAGDGGGGDLASKPPKQILADMSAALAKVRSYHVEGTEEDRDGRSVLAADVTAAGAAHITVRTAGTRLEILVAGGQNYMKADRAFWKRQGGTNGAKVAQVLGDRWVVAPPSAAGTFGPLVQRLSPRTLARCTSRNTGTPTKAGTRTVAGQRAIVIADKGDRPGGGPGELSIAATGRALPLRMTQTGPEAPGGKPDPECDPDGTSDTTASDVRFSRFDAPLRISAPANALDLGSLQRGSGSSETSS